MKKKGHHWRIVIFKSKHAVRQHRQLALVDGGAPGFPENCSAGLDSFDPRPIGYQGEGSTSNSIWHADVLFCAATAVLVRVRSVFAVFGSSIWLVRKDEDDGEEGGQEETRNSFACTHADPNGLYIRNRRRGALGYQHTLSLANNGNEMKFNMLCCFASLLYVP